MDINEIRCGKSPVRPGTATCIGSAAIPSRPMRDPAISLNSRASATALSGANEADGPGSVSSGRRAGPPLFSKPCKHCGNTMAPHSWEYPSHYRKRQFCGNSCSLRNRALTPRQRQMRAYLLAYQSLNNRPPMQKQIRHHLGTGSHSYIGFAFAKLARAGALRRVESLHT